MQYWGSSVERRYTDAPRGITDGTGTATTAWPGPGPAGILAPHGGAAPQLPRQFGAALVQPPDATTPFCALTIALFMQTSRSGAVMTGSRYLPPWRPSWRRGCAKRPPANPYSPCRRVFMLRTGCEAILPTGVFLRRILTSIVYGQVSSLAWCEAAPTSRPARSLPGTQRSL